MVVGLVGALAVLAQEVKPGKVDVVELGKDVNLEMVLIPAGKFKMGSPASEKDRRDNENQHEVTLTKPFYMGKYEVTQEQWEAVMGYNYSYSKGTKLPITDISWWECQGFIIKLNSKTDGCYRLPTDAEWEYSCRAGTSTAYWLGDSITRKDANYDGWIAGKPIRVGSYKANAFGLHDTHGNVHEWCNDWYDYLQDCKVTDPSGPVNGERRVVRGGSFYGLDVRSSFRGGLVPLDKGYMVGFRLARNS
jgi:formylglycine-generating enzyme required for sulfatase activity